MSKRLMCVLAHPDDESLGVGGTLAKYAREGVETYLVTATGGEHGWFGAPEDYPGPDRLRAIREEELHNAAAILGLQEVNLLGYEDGQLDQADPQEVIARIAGHLARVRPDVVITFDPLGAYGHPDHIAICQFTTAATVRSPVDKLYYMAPTPALLKVYQDAFGDLVMHVDGEERRAEGWPEWAVTTRIDTLAYWEQVWEAVACHQSQLPGYSALKELPEAAHRALWGVQPYYRAFSLVNGGRTPETDLFAGIAG
ncbi:MAG: PIG-L deacetylase family protein [Anaerolineae bacterium]